MRSWMPSKSIRTSGSCFSLLLSAGLASSFFSGSLSSFAGCLSSSFFSASGLSSGGLAAGFGRLLSADLFDLLHRLADLAIAHRFLVLFLSQVDEVDVGFRSHSLARKGDRLAVG